MKPRDRAVDWKRESAAHRVNNCMMMLHVHGFLSDAETAKVRHRIVKWIQKHAPDLLADQP